MAKYPEQCVWRNARIALARWRVALVLAALLNRQVSDGHRRHGVA
jgi:hypothetical protein